MDHADKGLATCTRQEKKHLAGEFQENAPESDTSPNQLTILGKGGVEVMSLSEDWGDSFESGATYMMGKPPQFLALWHAQLCPTTKL